MNRAGFQQLARLRIKEAKVLLGNGCYAGAYYLAGYAVECALKACIAKQTKRHDFPPDVETVRNTIYTHDLTKLLKPAGLTGAFYSEKNSNPAFERNWSVVKDWTEQTRYNSSIADTDAKDLYSAITGKNGVLVWLKRY